MAYNNGYTPNSQLPGQHFMYPPPNPNNQPPGKTDLEILEKLKQMIKDGQHDYYRAVPMPGALASHYLGPTVTPEQQQHTPASASQEAPSPGLVSTQSYAPASASEAAVTRPPRLKKDAWDAPKKSANQSPVRTTFAPINAPAATEADKTTSSTTSIKTEPMSATLPQEEARRNSEGWTQSAGSERRHDHHSIPPRDARHYDSRDHDRDYGRDRRDDRRYSDAYRRPPSEQRHYEPDYDRTSSRRYESRAEYDRPPPADYRRPDERVPPVTASSAPQPASDSARSVSAASTRPEPSRSVPPPLAASAVPTPAESLNARPPVSSIPLQDRISSRPPTLQERLNMPPVQSDGSPRSSGDGPPFKRDLQAQVPRTATPTTSLFPSRTVAPPSVYPEPATLPDPPRPAITSDLNPRAEVFAPSSSYTASHAASVVPGPPPLSASTTATVPPTSASSIASTASRLPPSLSKDRVPSPVRSAPVRNEYRPPPPRAVSRERGRSRERDYDRDRRSSAPFAPPGSNVYRPGENRPERRASPVPPPAPPGSNVYRPGQRDLSPPPALPHAPPGSNVYRPGQRSPPPRYVDRERERERERERDRERDRDGYRRPFSPPSAADMERDRERARRFNGGIGPGPDARSASPPRAREYAEYDRDRDRRYAPPPTREWYRPEDDPYYRTRAPDTRPPAWSERDRYDPALPPPPPPIGRAPLSARLSDYPANDRPYPPPPAARPASLPPARYASPPLASYAGGRRPRSPSPVRSIKRSRDEAYVPANGGAAYYSGPPSAGNRYYPERERDRERSREREYRDTYAYDRARSPPRGAYGGGTVGPPRRDSYTPALGPPRDERRYMPPRN